MMFFFVSDEDSETVRLSSWIEKRIADEWVTTTTPVTSEPCSIVGADGHSIHEETATCRLSNPNLEMWYELTQSWTSDSREPQGHVSFYTEDRTVWVDRRCLVEPRSF